MSSAVDRAYSAVRAGIISGRYVPNHRLTEQEVADEVGVSRTPVREALRRLHAEGLVRFVANQGAMVTGLSEGEIEEIFALRGLIEAYAAQRAATAATPAELATLEHLAASILAEAETRGAGYLDRIIELNSQFHHTLMEAARSARLEALYHMVVELPLVIETLHTYTEADLKRSAHHHCELVAALRASNGGWAASVMRSHLHAAGELFRRGRKPALQANLPGDA